MAFIHLVKGKAIHSTLQIKKKSLFSLFIRHNWKQSKLEKANRKICKKC